jgi:hypothetical protein
LPPAVVVLRTAVGLREAVELRGVVESWSTVLLPVALESRVSDEEP